MILPNTVSPDWTTDKVIEELVHLANPAAVIGMARFGITPRNTWGVSLPALRSIARQIGKNHPLALDLWAHDTREIRILAYLIDDPHLHTAEQMDTWVKDFDNREICDQCCANLFVKSPLAWDKALAWSRQPAEFTKRAGFVLMACLAVRDKKSPPQRFSPFFQPIAEEALDQRPIVKKAVNWALRQLGKRDPQLHQLAIQLAEQLRLSNHASARWIANNALRESQITAIQRRLSNYAAKFTYDS